MDIQMAGVEIEKVTVTSGNLPVRFPFKEGSEVNLTI